MFEGNRKDYVLDLLLFSYLLDTSIVAAFIPDKTVKISLLLTRLAIIAFLVVLYFHHKKAKNLFTNSIRWIYPPILLCYLFIETAHFHQIFFHSHLNFWSNQINDSLQISSLIPTLESHNFPALYLTLGLVYLSFYAFIFWLFVRLRKTTQNEEANKTIVILTNTILTYYILFLVFPFHKQEFMANIQHFIEFPFLFLGETGGFPSLKAGLVFLFLIFVWKQNKKLLPFSLAAVIINLIFNYLLSRCEPCRSGYFTYFGLAIIPFRKFGLCDVEPNN